MTDGWLGPARAAGLTYAKSCIDGLLERAQEFDIASDACSPDASDFLFWLPCEDECQIYFGTATIGEQCERFGRRMSTCAADLACGFDDICHAPCDLPQVIPEGGPCGYAVGLVQEHCSDGLVCDEATATCVVPTSTGAPCNPAAPVCGPADGCRSAMMTCEPRRALGAGCGAHDECISGVCDGQCKPPDPFPCGHQYF